jgi:hypothetical protein
MCNNVQSQLATVVGTTGDSITQFPGAEIIGTNGTGVGGNQVQLGLNTVGWTNGDVIEGPHPPAVNIMGLKVYANQITKANNAGSGLFLESWQGVSPGGSNGLNASYLILTDGGIFPFWWRVLSSDHTAKINQFFRIDVPVNTLIDTSGGGAPTSSMDLVDFAQTNGGTSGIRYYPDARYAFFSTSSAYSSISASNVAPTGSVGQVSLVQNTTPYALNVGYVSVSGDATLASTGALTLATVNGSPGSCGDSTHVCQMTTNGKGLVTSQTAVALGMATTSVNGISHPDNTTVGIDGTGKLSTKGFTGKCTSPQTADFTNGIATGCS